MQRHHINVDQEKYPNKIVSTSESNPDQITKLKIKLQIDFIRNSNQLNKHFLTLLTKHLFQALTYSPNHLSRFLPNCFTFVLMEFSKINQFVD